MAGMQIGDALVILAGSQVNALRNLVNFQRRALAIAEAALDAALRAAEERAEPDSQPSAMDSVPDEELTLRQRIEAYLTVHGPATSGLIALELGTPQGTICTTLGRHRDVFVKAGKSWALKRVEDQKAERD